MILVQGVVNATSKFVKLTDVTYSVVVFLSAVKLIG